jgi:nitrate reductase NapD
MRVGRFVDQEQRGSPGEGAHLCGVLVVAARGRADAVGRQLAGMAGVEVHQVAPDGRLIVTVEDTAEQWAGQILAHLSAVEGVLSTALVYHHCE